MKNLQIVVAKRGGTDLLKPVESELPQPLPNQVRVKILATGVAWADVMMREGIYPGVKFPLTPGYDIVGEIDACPEGVELKNGLPIGSRVAALTVTGGYAHYVCVPFEDLVPVPENIEATVAVSAVLNYLTAFQMLHRCTDLASGDTILVHGGAGGVGTALLQLARLANLKVFATASKVKHDLVSELGATPIDYKTEDFEERLKQEGGAHAIFDPIGGRNWQRSFRSLKESGTLICYGAYSALANGRLNLLKLIYEFLSMPRYAPIDLIGPSKGIVAYGIVAWKNARPKLYQQDLSEIFRLISEGKLQPIIDRVLPLGKAPEAHELLHASSIRGKIVLVPGEPITR